MLFWIIVTGLALVISALLVLALLRGQGGAQPAAAYDLRIYRDQLAEVNRDLERGVIAPEDGARVRTEVSRRILAADAALQSSVAQAEMPRMGWVAAVVATVALVGGALALYQSLGAPGYEDVSLKGRIAAAKEVHDSRPHQAEIEATVPPRVLAEQPSPAFLNLMVQLREAVTKRPDDLQGHVLLARNEATLANFVAAYHAQQQVIALKGDAVSSQDYTNLADLMILAAGGYVSPEAEDALKSALALDPENGGARYYVGQMFAQTGRIDKAFQIWEQLLQDRPLDAPWIAPIRAQIEDAARLAGVDFSLPAATGLAGPTAGDVAAASNLSDEDRQEMIRGMVGQLSDRLAQEGGTVAEWARLIGAYGVLGEMSRAQAIWQEANTIFAGDAAALATLQTAARDVGLIQ